MRLIKASFENFRLLKDLTLDFSCDPKKPLTVIRAANETGKTTILHALQWGFYGDAALPKKGEDFRLHPIDWPIATSKRVPITVTIEFETLKVNKIAGKLRESRQRYRLIRSAFEDLQNGDSFQRTTSTVKLLALNDTGATPINPPDALINEELPPELRDVFFTDGDRALSFIESDVALSTKRERVQRAIRALLGLGVIEDSLKHVKKSAADINKQARQIGGSSNLATIAANLEKIGEELSQRERELENAREQFTAFDERLQEVDKKISDTLRKGDREKLRRDLETAAKTIARIDERITVSIKNHSALFRSEALARDILAPTLQKTFAKLDKLYDRGDIPSTTIPVLKERIGLDLCICGESLKADGGPGEKRRKHILSLIDESKSSDDNKKILSDLFYSSKSLQERAGDVDETWIARYAKVVKERDDLQILRDDEGRKLKALELQLDKIPDTDIQGLRQTHREYRDQRDRFNVLKSKIETQIENIETQQVTLTTERDKILRELTKGARVLSELEVAKDIQDVLERAYIHLTNEELRKVSDEMNKIFLEMIGSDEDQQSLSIIRKAAISTEFDIWVFGPENRKLNPDLDLNGASRRALTLAFILALTKISEVEAPNVIDTPLGMMSGYVKKSVLRTAIRESSQLILFLTHDEIKGCEEIIKENIGTIFTLTNPAHYPKMLVHKPQKIERTVLRCECNHEQQCQICERRPDTDSAVIAA